MTDRRLFNLYTEYIMQNVKLDEAQAGIKIVRRNINNLRYADGTILMEESEEESKNLLMNGVLKSPTIIVLLLLSPFILVSIFLTYCGAPMLGVYIFIIVISSSWIDHLIIM